MFLRVDSTLMLLLLVIYLHSKHGASAEAQIRQTQSLTAVEHSNCLSRGLWRSDETGGRRWHTFDPNCPVEDYLALVKRGQHRPYTILLLSDSVDRYVTLHTCDYLGGTMQFFYPTERQNQTAYSLHTCISNTSLTLAASYFPGVHPTGPYHKSLRMNFTQRFDFVANTWHMVSERPPDLVMVSSLFWDIARLYFHEPEQLADDELTPDLIEAWSKNYTEVVAYAQSKFPETPLWGYHNSMPPKFNPYTGVMEKPYLGRLNYIHQLNAAGEFIALKNGLIFVDYYKIGQRLAIGQTYLFDLIHPKRTVSLELMNLYLSIVEQHYKSRER